MGLGRRGPGLLQRGGLLPCGSKSPSFGWFRAGPFRKPGSPGAARAGHGRSLGWATGQAGSILRVQGSSPRGHLCPHWCLCSSLPVPKRGLRSLPVPGCLWGTVGALGGHRRRGGLRVPGACPAMATRLCLERRRALQRRGGSSGVGVLRGSPGAPFGWESWAVAAGRWVTVCKGAHGRGAGAAEAGGGDAVLGGELGQGTELGKRSCSPGSGVVLPPCPVTPRFWLAW